MLAWQRLQWVRIIPRRSTIVLNEWKYACDFCEIDDELTITVRHQATFQYDEEVTFVDILPDLPDPAEKYPMSHG